MRGAEKLAIATRGSKRVSKAIAPPNKLAKVFGGTGSEELADGLPDSIKKAIE